MKRRTKKGAMRTIIDSSPPRKREKKTLLLIVFFCNLLQKFKITKKQLFAIGTLCENSQRVPRCEVCVLVSILFISLILPPAFFCFCLNL